MQTNSRAKNWLYNNIIKNEKGTGITVTDVQKVIYPEVSGYYIPTLLSIGEKELAISFAETLCGLQKPNGSWYDAYDIEPYIFDTGQILKGLLAVRDFLPYVDNHIMKGIDYIFSNVKSSGRLTQPLSLWDDEEHCNELILLYTLSPILDASRIYNIPHYTETVNKIIDYYIKNYRERIVNFSMFSHFYAYVVEAMVDCGRTEVAKEAMKNLEKYVKPNGAIYGYNNVKWYCSTAMFQFAVIWYKLGEKEKADRTFDFACSLQNPSGGWYGSYARTNLGKKMNRLWSKLGLSRGMYIKYEEISWAVKYYLDAKVLKDKSEGKNNTI